MKKLLIIRHAKSDWSGFGESDFERGLNSRGKKDAAQLSKKLFAAKHIPELIASSTALRAKLTSEIFADGFKMPKEKIVYYDQLYHAPSTMIYHIIAGLQEGVNHVAVVCHNPGITDFVNTLISKVQMDNMPTCGVFSVEADTDSWATFETAEKRFLFFERPERH